MSRSIHPHEYSKASKAPGSLPGTGWFAATENMDHDPSPIPPLDPALLLDQISDASYLLDTDWQIVLTNNAGERLLNSPRQMIEGRDFWKCFPGLVAQEFKEPLKKAMATAQPVTIPPYQFSASERYALRTQAVLDGILVFFHQETQSPDEEWRFRALVEHALDGVSLLDADLIPFYRSPANARILGVSNEEAKLIPYHPDDIDRVHTTVKALGPGESVVLEFRAVHKEGDWRWYRGAYTNRLNDPAVRGIVLNFSDITDRRKLDDQMEERRIELEESYKAQQLRLARLETLHRVHLASNENQDAHGSVRAILENSIARTVGVAFVYLEDTDELIKVTHPGAREQSDKVTDQAVRAIAAWCIEADRILFFDPKVKAPTDKACMSLAASGFKGGQVVPFARGESTGAVMILTVDRMQNDEESHSYLAMLAGHVANAVTTGRLLEQLERSARDYEALARFGHRIETVNDIDELVTTGLRELTAHLHMHFAQLAEIVGDFAVPRWIDGSISEEAEHQLLMPIPLDRGAVAQAARTGEMVLIPDYENYEDRPLHLTAVDFTSVLSLPIDAGKAGKYVFVLASNSDRNRITEIDASIARLFALRLSHAFERVAHLEDVKATREATFRALGMALEYRDFETKGHTDRVMEIGTLFASHLGITGDALQALQWGAYLHDLGKLSVPDEVLLKPAKLTFAEYELIKRHTLTGEEMCRNIPFLPEAAMQVVRHHHERWDGTGYPDGLAGSEIPLHARVFAIVDVYDALTSDRPYRGAWPHEGAMNYIIDQAGSQFDPELVIRFAELMALH